MVLFFITTTGAQIKDRLLIEDKRIEAFELRKNKDNNRKFNKQVKELRKAEGAAQRKQQIADVSNIRKEPAEGGESREDKVKKLIEAPVKSKKRQNMVRTLYILLRMHWLLYIFSVLDDLTTCVCVFY